MAYRLVRLPVMAVKVAMEVAGLMETVVMEVAVVTVVAAVLMLAAVLMAVLVAMETAVALLAARHGRFSFRRLRLVRLNVRPVFRWTTISDGREFFVDASRVQRDRRRLRPLNLRHRRLRIHRTITCQQLRHRRRVPSLALSRAVMTGLGARCDRRCLMVREG